MFAFEPILEPRNLRNDSIGSRAPVRPCDGRVRSHPNSGCARTKPPGFGPARKQHGTPPASSLGGRRPKWERFASRAFCQPPAQHVQPPSCARFTPQVPDGIIVIPGITLAAHSFAASSAPTLALLASILLWTCSATLQAPNKTPPRGQPVKSHIVYRKDASLWTQERILLRRCFGFWIDDLKRLADFVFFPHRVVECDREGAMPENDDGGCGFVGSEERIREGQRETRIDLVGVNHLAMAALQGSGPVRTVSSPGGRLRVR
jgi:hypothetical protein